MAGVLEQMVELRKPDSMCSYLMYICYDGFIKQRPQATECGICEVLAFGRKCLGRQRGFLQDSETE